MAALEAATQQARPRANNELFSLFAAQTRRGWVAGSSPAMTIKGELCGSA
jgi:hypothetical protein